MRFASTPAALYRRNLCAIFAASALALSGCATNKMNQTNTQDCMARKGSLVHVFMLFKIETRNDEYNNECNLGKAAVVFASMKTSDGKPDMAGYVMAAKLYRDGSPEVRKTMDELLKSQLGMTIDDVRFQIKKSNGTMECEEVAVTKPDGTKTTGFRCLPPKDPSKADDGKDRATAAQLLSSPASAPSAP